ncbi:MAG: Minf_1886 family protein [Verrucomicrobiales bacterium]
MQKQGFEEYARQAAEKDPRYDVDAYLFLRDALDFTIAGVPRASQSRPRHVRGPELLGGFRDLALREFGPLARTVLEIWGIHRCEDIGEMVFGLIEVGAFGKTEEDTRQDFANGYDFEDAFRKPFLPTGRPTRPPAKPARRANRRR